MKTLGLLGGMSWESTVPYYQLINRRIQERLGGLHSAKIVLYSVEFAEIERLQHAGDWHRAADILIHASRSLAGAGADGLVICTNTMHKLYPEIAASLAIPVLHIADATGESIIEAGPKTIGLLGTRFTMEEAFYRDRLSERFGLEVLIPERADREIVHRVIYDELCRGEIRPASRSEYSRILADLVERGAGGIVLGCTEIALLVHSEDSAVPLFDTAAIHARAAADWALET